MGNQGKPSVFKTDKGTFSLWPRDIKTLIAIKQSSVRVLKNTHATIFLHGQWKNVSDKSFDVLEENSCIETIGTDGNGTFNLTPTGHQVIKRHVEEFVRKKFNLQVNLILLS